MQELFVLLIVIAAAVYVFKAFYNGSKKGGDCGCGCEACDTDLPCDSDTARGQRIEDQL